MTTDPTDTDHDNEREWAARFLDEWARPYFGEDAADAVTAVMRAASAANAAETTLTQPTGRDHDHARDAVPFELMDDPYAATPAPAPVDDREALTAQVLREAADAYGHYAQANGAETIRWLRRRADGYVKGTTP